LRLEPDRLPLLLRPFDEDERDDFAVVRLRPPEEPFDELLLRLDEDLPRALEPDDFEPEPDDREPEPEPDDRDFELEPDDRDREPEPDERDDPERDEPEPEERERLDAELLLRELDDVRCFFTSPSSILPRQAPSSSSFIIT
jgi:hypothetical protein